MTRSDPQTPSRALVRTAYGGADVLHVAEVPAPSSPLAADEVCVRVHAAAICKGDIHVLTGTPYLVRAMGIGLARPKTERFGQEFAGVVEAVGAEVTTVAVGDAVFGQTPFGRFGAIATEVVVPASSVTPKPDALSFIEAAAMNDSATTALQAVRDHGKTSAGSRVLVNGASGGVGTFAVQIARALGAEVTAVVRTRNVEALRALGFDDVIDATEVDFTRGEARFDGIIDTVGNHAIGALARVLEKNGTLVAVSGGPMGNWVGPLAWMARLKLANLFSSRKLGTFVANPNDADRRVLAEFAREGKVRPVIDGVFTLDEAAKAVAHVEEGRTRGKTVVEVLRRPEPAPAP